MKRIATLWTLAAVFAIAAGAWAISVSAVAADKEPPASTREIVADILKQGIKIDIQESEPPNLVVTVLGQVPTGGWKNATLVRVVYDKPPKDGIADYILFADRPTGIVTQVISRVSATNVWKRYTKEAPWIKGIRVHGIRGGVVTKMLR